MANTEIKFIRVSTLPTSGYITGGVYFVTSENKIYVRTASGWEAYGGDSGAAYYIEESALADPTTDEAKAALDGVVSAVEAGTPVSVRTTGSGNPFTETYQRYVTNVFCNTFADTDAYLNDKYLVLYYWRTPYSCISRTYYRNKTTGAWTLSGNGATTLLTAGDKGYSVSSGSASLPTGDAVWRAIHGAPPTVVTEAVTTTLTSGSRHTIVILVTSNAFTATFTLPSSPMDGETFVFLKSSTAVTLTIKAGGEAVIYNMYNSSSAASVSSTSFKRKITVTYSSTLGYWMLMADSFMSL